MSKKIIIEGMSCMHCVNHVKNALIEIDGVKDAEVNLKEKYALAYGDNISNDEIKGEIEDAGYEVISIEEI